MIGGGPMTNIVTVEAKQLSNLEKALLAIGEREAKMGWRAGFGIKHFGHKSAQSRYQPHTGTKQILKGLKRVGIILTPKDEPSE